MTLRSISFDVVGIAQPKGSTRAFLPKGSTRPIVTTDNPKIKGWQQLVAEQAQTAAAGGRFDGAVTLTVDFYLPRPKTLPRRVVDHCKKPDLDKLVRSVNDALTGILYTDDAQVIAIVASKRYALGLDAPRALITLTATGDDRPRALRQPLFAEDLAHGQTHP